MEKKKRITDHNHDKYITTTEFNKFIADIFALRSWSTFAHVT